MVLERLARDVLLGASERVIHSHSRLCSSARAACVWGGSSPGSWRRTRGACVCWQVCEDVNECLATNVRVTNPDCGCPRCACVNMPGSYK